MLPEVAVTVTVEVPGVTGVGTPEAFEEPPHPAKVKRTISRDSEPAAISMDFERRLLQNGKRAANPSGKMALAVTMGLTVDPA